MHLLASAAIADGQICQDLDIGDGIGKRESISAPHFQRPQQFHLFTIGFRKNELTLSDPDICNQQMVRDASNKFIDGRLVVHAGGEPNKISPPHDPAIEQPDKTLGLFAQGNPGLHQQTTVSGHAGRNSAVMHEWRRGCACDGKRTGLVYSTELSRIALNPASHQRGVVVDIAIRTPRYSRPLPCRVEEDTEPATLISGRIQLLIVLRSKLIIREECDRVTWTAIIKLDTGWKDLD